RVVAAEHKDLVDARHHDHRGGGRVALRRATDRVEANRFWPARTRGQRNTAAKTARANDSKLRDSAIGVVPGLRARRILRANRERECGVCQLAADLNEDVTAGIRNLPR